MADSSLFIATYPWRYRSTAFPVTTAQGVSYGLFHSPGGAYFYGGAPDPTEADATQADVTTEALRLISASVAAAATPEVIEARIANLKAYRARVPLLRGVIDARINVLAAKLRSARKSEAKTAQWSALGRTGIGVGIIAGLAVTGLAVAAAVALSRKQSGRQWQSMGRTAMARGY